MAYEPEALLDLLNREFEFDRAKAFEFGWCNVLEAEDRGYKRPVYIYYPRAEVWADSAARKTLTKQMTAYDQLEVHECLPQAVELLTGKKAAGAIALITGRSVDANLTVGEREGDSIGWEEFDTFSFPDKLGAARRFAEGFGLLHDFGMVHGAIGHQTVSVRRKAEKPLIRVDLLNFSELGEKLPAPSLFFEPAFTAPELFGRASADDPLAYTRSTDVYALAKLLIYILIGPRNFMDFFVPSQADAPGEDNLLAQLFDHVLWGNIAQRKPDLGATRLESLAGGKLNSELAELMDRSVAYEPAKRPADAQVFYHGLRSVMSGALETQSYAPMGGGGINRPTPKKDGPNYVALGAAAVLVLAVLGGGWYWMDQRAKEQQQASLFADTRENCGAFVSSMDGLSESTITQMERWEDVTSLRTRVEANGQDPAKLAESRDFCVDGIALLNTMRAQLVNSLKAQADLEIEFAEDNGTNLTPLGVQDRLAAVASFEQNRDFLGTEKALLGLIDGVVLEHDKVLQEKLRGKVNETLAAQTIMGKSEPGEDAGALIAEAEALSDTAPSSDVVKRKFNLMDDMDRTTRADMTEVARARINEIQGLTETLTEAGAGNAATGFSELQTAYQSVIAQDMPTTIAEFQTRYGELDRVQTGMERIRQDTERLAAELPALETRLDATVKRIRENRWQDEAKLPDLVDRYRQFKSRTVVEDHIALTALDAAFTERLGELDAEWERGRGVCQTMLNELGEVNGLEDASIWAQLNPILSRVRQYDTPRATRDMFTDCAKARQLIERGQLELRAADLIAEMRQTKEMLEDKGLGDFITQFAAAKSSFETLTALKTPTDQASYATFSEQAFAAINNFDEAEAAFDDAQSLNQRLTGAFTEIQARIADSPLSIHPAYGEAQSELQPTDIGNVMVQNVALQTNVDRLTELLRAFEAGELMNCDFNGYAMLPFDLPEDRMTAGLGLIGEAAEASGFTLASVPAADMRFCISPNPVSVEDLNAFREKLRVRQQDIRNEIDVVRPAEGGAATNVSFWLAERFAEHIGEGAEEPVCVAAAYATAMAATSGRGDFSTDGGGEVFSDSCGDGGAVGKRLVLYGVGTDTVRSGCVSVNSRQPDLTFRLAAGDICR
jgi:hypothetical protein